MEEMNAKRRKLMDKEYTRFWFAKADLKLRGVAPSISSIKAGITTNFTKRGTVRFQQSVYTTAPVWPMPAHSLKAKGSLAGKKCPMS
jgi:hypothetical protein